MGHRYAEIAFTLTVQSIQEEMGSRRHFSRLEQGQTIDEVMGPEEAEFIQARDSFYMASVGETGWPYVQHRGGPPGFLKVLNPRMLGFADFRGNRQYVSVGNLQKEDRVALILVDYPRRMRLKLLGRMRIASSEDASLLARFQDNDYLAHVERVLLLEVAGVDWNCAQHITPRFSAAEVHSVVAPLQARIDELEKRLVTRSHSAAD